MNKEEYDKYILGSQEWKQVKEAVKKRYGNKCRMCGCKDNLEVHHVYYQDENGEDAFFNENACVLLCKECHAILTDAVEKAKSEKITVPAFEISSAYDKLDVIMGMKIEAAKQIHRETLIVDTVMRLWERMNKPDCDAVNLRKKEPKDIVCKIVEQTLWQAGKVEGLLYKQKITEQITVRLAEAYNEYKAKGKSDSEFSRDYKIEWSKLDKIRVNALTLMNGGTIFGDRG